MCMMNRADLSFSKSELCFIIYGGGWVFDECASILEHGWEVHVSLS